MKSILTVIAALLFTCSFAQNELGDLSDEFNDTSSLRQWRFFHQVENYPDKIDKISVGNGILNLQPKASGWYADNQAPFLFKMVTGNFDVRARIRVKGEATDLPSVDWSLAGLMVRQPKRTTSANWIPRQENWLFITTGVADDISIPVMEMKTTSNSISNLKLRPAKAGWIELRIVHVDAAFVLMSRAEGEKWQIQERFYRPVMMGPLQVGLNAYSCWNAIPPPLKSDPKAFNETVATAKADLLLQVDYVRFSRPVANWKNALGNRYDERYQSILFYTPANLLTDYSISNEQVLALLGD
ncbi:DUF1349 domain-containing protein [Terrimonas sp. NA20]|uniref:DUF1349 domain-containing protein n=1 Tax=Terrimonas ginsenosidimutans TaxID=2908004 RepID=A0ABS9KYC8_9BACT|nr:DUF1349 domain-containing protein [Terrimonas ginsenosidimutans]MCG2617352.1 DUF1349 domain-containing protein [Terrimonas ginsenosidimutans]